MNVAKVIHVARREFASTALTKGFIIGALVVPVMFALVMPLIGWLIQSAAPPPEVGRVAIADRSGQLGALIAERLSPEALDEARGGTPAEIVQDAQSGQAPDPSDLAATANAMLGDVPKFQIDLLGADADIEAVKDRLLESHENKADRTLAIVDIDTDAVERAEGETTFGGYTLYTRPEVDVRTSGTIENTVERAIKDTRFRIAGVDADEINALTRIHSGGVQEVTEGGTRESNKALKMLLPFGVIMLLFMGVMTGGQYLLTTMVEEKASRVVEVLLSAVSPMELMAGKILGQMLVGLLMVVMYSSVGIGALLFFGLSDMLEWTDLLYMLIFFLIAYVMIAAFMAAIGSAVNELREAQSLMAPVMIVLVLTLYLSFPVSLSPSAPWAVAMSFIPPVSPFAMLTRIASTEPPPAWQVWLSILISGLAAWAMVWIAAKIFRVGLLMFGKPPNFTTLVRWIRMA
ncbi:MAG: hypothetical protein DHS20C14_14960 [Phycisphaeraceae bacterium]|nr:MAG: hypothetical protein DHS20C14_14960 [Phycisphaeraceae bacterium]